MQMPTAIQEMANAGLQSMHANPAHHYDWRIRRQTYKLFSPPSDPVVCRARRYLPIIAAEHVLPIFSARFPDEGLPRKLLDTAIGLTDGSIEKDDPAVHVVEDEGYHATGGFLALDQKTESMVHNASYAAFATYKALVEVRYTQDPWLHAAMFHKSGNLYSMGARDDLQTWPSGEEFTDQDWASLAAAGDTAAPAAVAVASSEVSPYAQSDKLEQFWRWWVGVALPLAWERADG
jgi:hypothetical protein